MNLHAARLSVVIVLAITTFLSALGPPQRVIASHLPPPAEIVVNTIFDCVRDSLTNGDKTEIRGFGSFRLRSRRMKEGRNPKTGATVAVPAKKVPFFKAGKELKELFNQ